MNPSDCPSGNLLDDFFADRLASEVASDVESHLSGCPHCLEELRRRDSALSMAALLQNPDDPPPFPSGDASADSLIQTLKIASRGLEIPEFPSLSPSTVDPAETQTLDEGEVVFEVVGKRSIGAGPLPTGSLRYQPLRSHAKGGLGEVFVARDTELNREVALKEIQARFAGIEECRARFLSEAEITGGLEHPGIVPVYGLGAYSDGRPYYAMRFIRGDNLQSAAEGFHQAGRPDFESLEFRQLLSRFVDVCNAVAYAHSRGVIHRDLKPSNIMLGDFGETLVVDWGLAKVGAAVDAELAGLPLAPSISAVETLDGSLVGTPAYMSPEQAAGKIEELSPATDIYSLGATLFFLLTKRAPHAGDTVDQLLAQVRIGKIQWRADDPAVPLALRAICEKAMALRAGDRYPAALKLAEEVENWLADEPVAAYREPTLAQMRRWMRKHSGVVAAVTASVLVAIFGVTVGALILNQKNQELASANGNLESANRKLDTANRDLSASNHKLDLSQKETEKKRQEAESERLIAKAVRDFLQRDLLRHADPAARNTQQTEVKIEGPSLGANPTVKELLDRTATELAPDKIEAKFPKQPELQAEILATVGETYTGLGNYVKAREFLERATKISEAELGPDHPSTWARLTSLAVAESQFGENLEKAIPLFEEVLFRRRKVLGQIHPEVRDAMGNLALALQAVGRVDAAVPYFKEIFDLEEKERGADHPDTLLAMVNLGQAYMSQGRTDAAVRMLESAHEKMKRVFGENHAKTLTALINVATANQHAGRYDDAIRLFKEAHDKCEADFGADHPMTLDSLGRLAGAYCQSKDTAVGIPLYLQQLDRLTAKFGVDYLATLTAGNNLAKAFHAAKKYGLAIRAFEQTHARALKKLGPDHPFIVSNLSDYARAEIDSGDWAAGAEHLQQVYDWLRAKKGANDPETLQVMKNLALCLGRSGQHARAIPLFELQLARLRETLGPAHPETLNIMRNLAASLVRSGNHPRGFRLFEDALIVETTNLGPNHPVTLNSTAGLGKEYLEQKKPEKGLPLIDEFVEGQRRLMGAKSLNFAGVLSLVSVDLLKAMQYVAAEKYLREARTIMENLKPRVKTHWQKTLLGEALLGQKKFAESEPLLREGWEEMLGAANKVTAANEKQVRVAGLQRLIDLYTALEKPEEAAKWQKELDARKSSSSPATPATEN